MRFLTSLLVRCLPVAVFMTLCVAGVATTAQAAPPESPPVSAGVAVANPLDTTCAGGDLCFWVDINRGGAKGRVSGNNLYWSNFAQTSCQEGTWSNCASSIWNNGNNCDVWVFENFAYGGHNLYIQRGKYISDLTGYWITYPFDSWNDDIQSNKWCSLT